MNFTTKFPFYDHVLSLLNPHLPMIVNDMSGHIVEVDADIDIEEELYEDIFYDEHGEPDDPDGDLDYLNIAISFERGYFPDSDFMPEPDENPECDYEVIIKPFFTIKPYLLVGLHNNKTKQFFAEIIDFHEFQPIDILETFAKLVHALFRDETMYNKVFIMTTMSHLAIRELISFDEPTYIKGNSGDVQYVSSPYFELDNPPIHEFLIKQKYSS